MYAQDSRYRAVVDQLAAAAIEMGGSFDYVSGGQRRDWFFSIAVANRLQRPHLYLYKDRSATLTSGDGTQESTDLGRLVLHPRRRPGHRGFKLCALMDSGVA